MHHRQFALVVLVIMFAGCSSAEQKTENTNKTVEGKSKTNSKNKESAIEAVNLPKLDSPEAYYNRGIDWLKKGEYDKVIADCNEAIRLDPKLALAFNNRGSAWTSKGEYDKAIDDFNEAIRLSPNFAVAFNNLAAAHNNRGVYWSKKGEHDKAMEDYAIAAQMDPKYAKAYDDLGLTWKKKDDGAKAEADFKKAKAPETKKIIPRPQSPKAIPIIETVKSKSNTKEKSADSNEGQEASIAYFKKLGGKVTVDEESPGKPVIKLSFKGNTKITDGGLVHLKELPNLQELNLGLTKITDSGLVHLNGLVNLQELNLGFTNVSDAGLGHLQGLVNLQGLNLGFTNVSDAGLVHLEGLANLRSLGLENTEVTKAGVEKLQKVLPECDINGVRK